MCSLKVKVSHDDVTVRISDQVSFLVKEATSYTSTARRPAISVLTPSLTAVHFVTLTYDAVVTRPVHAGAASALVDQLLLKDRTVRTCMDILIRELEFN